MKNIFKKLKKRRNLYLLVYDKVLNKDNLSYDGSSKDRIYIPMRKKVRAFSFTEARKKIRIKRGYDISNINVTRLK